jgi:hypothetical protein
MRSRFAIAIVAVAAFAFGFAAARMRPARPASPLDDLALERVGDAVRLTAKSADSRYLVLAVGAEEAASQRRSPGNTIAPFWAGSTVTVPPPFIVSKILPRYMCRAGVVCNECTTGDSCEVPPPPPRGRQIYVAGFDRIPALSQ